MKGIMLAATLLVMALCSRAQEGPAGIAVGATAPDFKAMDQQGKTVILKEQLKKGPVVLVFYRGYWCPYCNKALKQLEDSLSMINAKGAQVIAVSAEKAENIQKTVTKTGATYPVLFDEGLQIMKNYDVAYAVDSKMMERYRKHGIDFMEVNGRNGANLPVPAVFVINTKGMIVYRHFDPDYTRRAPVAAILEHL